MNTEFNARQLYNILSDSNAQTVVRDMALPGDEVTRWLARLVLLSDVPFHNIIPTEGLLPKESLRFFYIDPSWQNAMVDGALSVGNNTSVEIKLAEIISPLCRENAHLASRGMRRNMLGLRSDKAEDTIIRDYLISGMMLRSEIVSTWEGLKVIARYPAGQDADVVPLRFEKIGNDLLLIIFPGVPETITIQQPAQGLQLGVDENAADQTYSVLLRGLGTGGFETGKQIMIDKKTPLKASFAKGEGKGFYRKGGKNVLDIESIKAKIQQTLKDNKALEGDAFGPAAFAMQLLVTPKEVSYANSLKAKKI